MIVLVTGASGSGKSEYAERIAAGFAGEHVYIATMHIDESTETKDRIKKHQKQRSGYGFITIEKEKDIGEITGIEGRNILIECMSNLLSNEMFINNLSKEEAVKKIVLQIKNLAAGCPNMVIVTNEVFSDGCVYDKTVIDYIDALAEINKELSCISDCVAEIVYSIPVYIKGQLI